MKKVNLQNVIGVSLVQESIYLYYVQRSQKATHPLLFKQFIASSSDGLTFKKLKKPWQIRGIEHRVNPKIHGNIHTAKLDTEIMTFTRQFADQISLCIAKGNDVFNWEKISDVPEITSAGVFISEYKEDGWYILLFGDKSLQSAKTKDFHEWIIDKTPIMTPSTPHESIEVSTVLNTEEGILVIYCIQTQVNGFSLYSLHALLLEKNNLHKILWKLPGFWTEPVSWHDHEIKHIGIIEKKDALISYWHVSGKGTIAIPHPLFTKAQTNKTQTSFLILAKYHKNPILEPDINHSWESQAVFNPTALHSHGKTHLLYRAVGDGYISTLGYASSSDGIIFDERLDEPAYVPRETFEGIRQDIPYTSPYVSGIGYGGCEDPRLTKIGNMIYVTYVAFDGWSPPRVALSSIPEKDFYSKKWNKWSKPVLISRPGVVDKNACILPEKINGKFVVFHRIFPNILIDFIDDLNFGNGKYLQGEHRISPRAQSWDSRKVGIGPTPLKTKYGWLAIYHAVDDRDDTKYKVGVMLLDLLDPTKVLLRSNKPILEPTEWYENEGFKSGVAYPCGSTLVNNTLFVYYGGADMRICVAMANLDDVISSLEKQNRIHFQSRQGLQITL